jgi:hypothetical protein
MSNSTALASAKIAVVRLERRATFAQGNLGARDQYAIGVELDAARQELEVQEQFAAGSMFVAVGTFEVTG